MGAGFHHGARTVRAPATSANLGPGFDTFGLALSRYDVVTAEVIEAGLEILVTGEAAELVHRSEEHLVLQAMRTTFDRLGGQPPGLRLTCQNWIPHGRGLGSSAAAIVSGICLARALSVDGTQALGLDDTIALASEIEGHPDNVAACLLGGFTIAWTEAGRARAVTIDPAAITPVLFIPTTQSATSAARAALPNSIPHSDAAFNVGRAALLVRAMTGAPEYLLAATEDRLHQAQRASSMADSAALMRDLRAAGIAAVISGAGSTVLALAASSEQVIQATSQCPDGWRVAALSVGVGASIDELPAHTGTGS
jgi:homoserine kinase